MKLNSAIVFILLLMVAGCKPNKPPVEETQVQQPQEKVVEVISVPEVPEIPTLYTIKSGNGYWVADNIRLDNNCVSFNVKEEKEVVVCGNFSIEEQ